MPLPKDFTDRMTAQLGDSSAAFFQALQSDAPVSVRLNPFKDAMLFQHTAVVPWCQSGRYLEERPSFTRDPYFHAGCYYVQEASSMYIGRIVEDHLKTRPVRLALDLCAAPGGKSTHLRSVLPDGCLLVSNEVIPSRNLVLCQNMAKWGHPGTVVTRNEADEFARSGVKFDLILVDAPCSGEGMFRKDPSAIHEWSLSSVTACSLRQKSIVAAAVQSLAPGGLLLYSTCTWSPEEDDDIAHWLSEECGLLPVPLPRFPGVHATKEGAFFYPHLVKGEGFYISAFLKSEELAEAPVSITAKRKRMPVQRDSALEEFKREYFPDDELVCVRIGEHGWVLPSVHFERWEQICSVLRVFSSGVKAAEQKGKAWIPAAEAALSTRLGGSVDRLEVDEESALRYLRGETIALGTSFGGWRLVSYKGFGLGWGKAVHGRLNNGYPKEWRIRMDISH